MSFVGKVVLVTGASSGIGAATAILFSKEGAEVSMVGRNESKLKKVSEKCIAAGKAPLVIIADVSKEDDVKRIVKETIDKFGRLDVLVNNAVLGKSGSILEGNFLEAYDTTMSVNVRAVINLTTLAAPYLVVSKGNIINISSVSALSMPPNPKRLSYHVSKAALDQFTRDVAKELAPSGVRVNSVNPGPVMTDFLENSDWNLTFDNLKEMTEMKRLSTAEEIADTILHLAGEKARGVTGSIYVVDNGFLLGK